VSYAALRLAALRLRVAEAIASRQYWQSFAHVPIRFDSQMVQPGSRALAPGWAAHLAARSQTTEESWDPAHAILNYLYAILQTEATIVAQWMGFDPTLGLMHTRQALPAIACRRLMEPPTVDRITLELLREREFSRGKLSRLARAFAGWH
jgi:CRISPR/Cas system-associated endonuclease Cas1